MRVLMIFFITWKHKKLVDTHYIICLVGKLYWCNVTGMDQGVLDMIFWTNHMFDEIVGLVWYDSGVNNVFSVMVIRISD